MKGLYLDEMYVGCMGWVLSFLARVLTVCLVMKSGCGIVTDECLSLISEVPLLPLPHLGCSLPGTSKLICLWGLVDWSQYFSFTSLFPREDQRDWQGSLRKGSALGCFSFLGHILRLIRVSPGSLSSTQISILLDLGNEDLFPIGNSLRISPPSLAYLGKVRSGLS